MGGPRSVYSSYWWSSVVTLTPNSLVFCSAEIITRQSNSLPEIRKNFLLFGMYFSLLLSCLSPFPNLPTPFSYISSSIYTPLLVGSSWWKDIPYVSRSLYIILQSEGPHFLMLIWPSSNSRLTPIIARQANSPKALSLDHGMSWGAWLVCSTSSTKFD